MTRGEEKKETQKKKKEKKRKEKGQKEGETGGKERENQRANVTIASTSKTICNIKEVRGSIFLYLSFSMVHPKRNYLHVHPLVLIADDLEYISK